ncbi:hypothetical protein C8R46DRAFT_901412 [Mycena filopes]|nr:hypothetical protein C8R46DRAFT_901412 [Mycena filopes]
MSSTRQGSCSLNGGRSLLPAIRPSVPAQLIPEVPALTLVAWTFGRGSVIWKIWPAVLMHILFAVGVVYFWEFMERKLDIPNVMLTLLGTSLLSRVARYLYPKGVVIGFVVASCAQTHQQF